MRIALEFAFGLMVLICQAAMFACLIGCLSALIRFVRDLRGVIAEYRAKNGSNQSETEELCLKRS